MDVPAVVLAGVVTLSFSLPDHRVGSDCGTIGAPLTDLDSCYVWGRTVGGEQLVRAFNVAGLEGWTFWPTVPDSFLEAGVEVSRKGSWLRSCPAWTRIDGGTSSVPVGGPNLVPEAVRLRSGLFDVMGRRIEAAGPSGVVWARDSVGVVTRRTRIR